jgi:hypothetical protein
VLGEVIIARRQVTADEQDAVVDNRNKNPELEQ